MKREEEILQRAKEEAWYIADTSQTKEDAAIGGYCLGAKYADKTMLDRACEWLNKILYIHTEIEEDKDWGETNPTNWVTSDYDTVGEFITAFRQAMEGGAE